MVRAWIDGRPAVLDDAVVKAAALLVASRCPLIAIVGADVAGARMAVGLAERTGAAIDLVNSDALFRNLAVMRETGRMVTTPNEARLRADTLLLVGPGLDEGNPELSACLQPQSSDGAMAGRRSIIRLCPGRARSSSSGHSETTIVGRDPDHLPGLLAALRARLAGRPAGKAGVSAKTLEALVERLKAARFGVAVWSAAAVDALAVEMLCGIVDDLNVTTRFTGFSLSPGDNAVGVLQVCGWMTGFPPRTGFGRGYPEHDPWRFDGARMVQSGEADCVVWVSAYRAAAPLWGVGPPLIALTSGDEAPASGAAIHIEVGRPGRDHDSVEHHAAIATLVSRNATRPTDAISVADALGRILAAVGGAGATP
jgi:formylmethanofuran dehydrogenase subunit B